MLAKLAHQDSREVFFLSDATLKTERHSIQRINIHPYFNISHYTCVVALKLMHCV